MKTNLKVRYEAPEAQVFHVESENAICDYSQQQSPAANEAMRQSYGNADEI